MKRLFGIKFDTQEIVTTIIILMVLLLAYAYKIETQQCRDWITPIFKGERSCDSICGQVREDMAKMNVTAQNKGIGNLTIVGDVNPTAQIQ